MVVAVVVLQLGFVARGYWSDHKEFAFQMFPESSTWRADVVRVTADGRRVPIERPWSGYRWDELVPDRGLQLPRRSATTRTPGSTTSWRSSRPRSTGSRTTPRATVETRYLEATVTSWHNADPPRVEVLRSRVREDAGERGRGRRAARAAAWSPRSTSCSAARSACGRSRCCGCWPARSCSCTCGRSSSDALDGRIYRDAFYEPYAAWYPELPRAVYVGLLWLAAVAAVAMSLGFLTRLATATTFAIVAYNLFLSTTHFHNNRAYLVIVLGLLAVAPCGRELSLDAWLRRRRGRPALDPSAPAWPLWLLRFECAAIYGGVRAEQARSIPTGSAAPSPGSASCRRGTSSTRGRCRTGRCRS